ncbi:MAG TPA: YhgN family NAAT transporter [Dyella sp.]|uniref:YhgN family NAAT transporter n=1 Tax=Dyella sp. TaxID=1869338 RepID=UPI002C922807|nr:YhgN family NAAT transporter [Dyella sp.]HUB88982.1 YhgN family NAAT transporter [Dyella sp.]
MTTLSAAILLFLIMDPLGNIPLFLSLLKDVPPKRRRAVMVRELLIALAVLLVFLMGGQLILRLLQLREESISIAGGIVLFLIGIRMVFPPAEGGVFGQAGEGEPFIVPMAIPGVAGPSAMAALLLLTNTQPGRTADWAIALLCAWLATAVILLSSTYLFRWLGESVLTALERVMGMLLIALSVQMFLGGIAAYLHLTV